MSAITRERVAWSRYFEHRGSREGLLVVYEQAERTGKICLHRVPLSSGGRHEAENLMLISHEEKHLYWWRYDVF